MIKKRSIGITIFAWFIIFISCLVFYFNQTGDERNSEFSVFFYNIICPVFVIVAFYLLKLKSWARVGVVTVSLLVAFENIITTPYALSHAPERNEESIVIIFMVLVFTFAVIYYFNRTKVKEQFK